MKIRWLRLALMDLDEIYEYIAEDNQNAAKKIINLIWQKTKVLSEHPEIGRPGRVLDTKELYINKTMFIVPYRVRDNTIEILRVFHTSKNWPKEF